MKTFKQILTLLVLAACTLTAGAQVVKKIEKDAVAKQAAGANGAAISGRQQAFYEVKKASDADRQWEKIIYRSLDLTKGKNASLYYPEEPNEDGQSLFFIIMRLLANDQISAYEYLDGREMFTDEYKVKVGEMLERFHVMATPAKGSNEKHPKYTIEDADIPGNEILSYYIIERWEFDTRSNQMKTYVDAICPVLHRMDEYGGEAIKYPMFWVKVNDIRPFMAQQYIFTDDDNNLTRYSIDDFFKLNMYEGEIYKTKNMRNMSLRQLYPEDKDFKHAQDSIEARLHAFNKDMWVPSREELQAAAEAKAKAEAEAEAAADDGGPIVDDDNDADKKAEDKATKRTTKRGAKVQSEKKESKSKNTQIKQRKPKAPKASSSSGATRSVRNRKK